MLSKRRKSCTVVGADTAGSTENDTAESTETGTAGAIGAGTADSAEMDVGQQSGGLGGMGIDS